MNNLYGALVSAQTKGRNYKKSKIHAVFFHKSGVVERVKWPDKLKHPFDEYQKVEVGIVNNNDRKREDPWPDFMYTFLERAIKKDVYKNVVKKFDVKWNTIPIDIINYEDAPEYLLFEFPVISIKKYANLKTSGQKIDFRGKLVNVGKTYSTKRPFFFHEYLI